MRAQIDVGRPSARPPLSSEKEHVRSAPAPRAASVDPASPIGQKWQAEGGEAKVGKPLRDMQSALGGKLRYQEFQNGVILFSEAFGAVMVRPEIFRKWSTHPSLPTSLGCPIADSFRVTRPVIGSADAAYFERGMIVARANGQAAAIQGRIYERYRDLNDVRGVLEYPQSDEEAAPGGGRRSRFTHGDIYWKSATGAAEVHGAIRAKWEALGGSGGLLGFPVSDEERVVVGTRELGRFSRFEKGVIYWSPRTGAQEVHGAILSEWENIWGGATGPLGFPTSDETATPTSGGRFNNFERGCLVWHPDSSPFKGVHTFSRLEFYLDRFGSKGSDGIGGGGQDLYVKTDVQASTGQSFKQRMPEKGNYGPDEEIDRVLVRVPVVRGDLVVTVKLEGWDSDTFDDDRLGTVNERYSVDNLWGILENASHWRGDFLAVYKFRNPMPADLSNFRQKLFWQFDNFKTARLSDTQYAQTFRDVSHGESAIWNPFDKAYYHIAYKGVAGGGNCFGMCLESVYAQVGRSIYSEPIARVPPTNGTEPSPSMHAELINEINIKHGYQTGAGCIDYFLGQFTLGRTHDPKDAFTRSRDMFRRGDYPVMVVTNGMFKVGGHVVRPYAWDTSNPARWVIRIADPNVPQATQPDDLNERCIIEVDPRANTFRYHHGYKDGKADIWTGGTWTGGRMYPIPFSALCRQPRTPFWEVFGLLLSGVIIVLAEDGESQQITDGAGRTFYEPGLANGPALWEHIRRDPAQRIRQMARVPLIQSGNMPELYVVNGAGEEILRHEVRGRQSGQYQWAMRSPLAAASISSATTAGARETVTAARFGGERPDVTLALPRDARAKRVRMAVAGRAEGREARGAFELQELPVEPGHQVKVRLVERGHEIEVENSGPATRFDLTLRAAADARATVTKRGVALGGGQAMRLRPADWSPGNLGRAPVRIEELSGPGGGVIKRFDL